MGNCDAIELPAVKTHIIVLGIARIPMVKLLSFQGFLELPPVIPIFFLEAT